MSKETRETLNTLTLKGFCDLEKYGDLPQGDFVMANGRAWHDSPELRERLGVADNHYPGPIPVADVVSRLFNFSLISAPMFAGVPAGPEDATSLDSAGNMVRIVECAGRQVIVRDDTTAALGVFREGYKIHQYRDWLIDELERIMGDRLHVGSAGLLRDGGMAWVQIRTPESVTTAEGVEFVSWILAATSCDGSTATQYTPAATLGVCDNSVGQLLGSMSDRRIKLRHTTNSLSLARIADVRTALGIITESTETFSEEIATLCASEVTSLQWDRFLAQLTAPKNSESKAAVTRSENRREVLDSLYRTDPRCAPWVGTKFGAFQAVNTYRLHVSSVHGGESKREGRNMLDLISSKGTGKDVAAMTLLDLVCA